MNNSNSLVLLRGLPGAGKSTLATILSENNLYPTFSVDDYFTNALTGEYIFDFANNHIAYKHCENNTKLAMQNNTKKIFVHNTFTFDWELEPYFLLAKEFNYLLFVTTIENYQSHQNTHGVSHEQLQKMATKYNVKLY